MLARVELLIDEEVLEWLRQEATRRKTTPDEMVEEMIRLLQQHSKTERK